MATTAAHETNGTTTSQNKARDPDFYGGATRFELELEFVQALSNPLYIHHLAATKHLEDPDFVRYLAYLQYFREEKYIRYMQYPGPTLRALDLLQQEQFRQDAISPAVIDQMVREGFEAATKGLSQ